MSLEVAYGEVHTCSSHDHEACETRPAYRPPTREDILTAVKELGGLEVDFRAPIMVPGKLHVEDMWMRAGRYLIVPLDTGDTEPTLCPVCKDDPGEVPCLTCMDTGLVDTGDTE
jgi:hypothetical protein